MKKEQSAGGIILKKENNKTKILLVEHKDKTYVFPKGHIEKGETPEEAAKREIKEEVGLSDIKICEKIGTVTRHSIKLDGTKVYKDIILFLVKVDSYNHTGNTEECYEWFTIDEALKKLRYEEDLIFLKNIIKKYI